MVLSRQVWSCCDIARRLNTKDHSRSISGWSIGIISPDMGPRSRPLLSGTPIRALGSWTTLIASCRPLTFVTFEDILILEF